MLKGKFIIILILLGIIGKVNDPTIRYSTDSNISHSTFSKTSSKKNSEVNFLFEETLIEEEDENENNPKKYFNHKQVGCPNFLHFTTNILFVKSKLANNNLVKKQFRATPLYISFANLRI